VAPDVDSPSPCGELGGGEGEIGVAKELVAVVAEGPVVPVWAPATAAEVLAVVDVPEDVEVPVIASDELGGALGGVLAGAGDVVGVVVVVVVMVVISTGAGVPPVIAVVAGMSLGEPGRVVVSVVTCMTPPTAVVTGACGSDVDGALCLAASLARLSTR
jgi:hypothetical protein